MFLAKRSTNNPKACKNCGYEPQPRAGCACGNYIPNKESRQ